MVGTGSSINTIFNHAYEKMTLKLKKKLGSYDDDLYDFNNQSIRARGVIALPMKLHNDDNLATCDIEFLVVVCWLPYNDILSQPSQSTFKMVSSSAHLKAKFSTCTKMGNCCGD